MCVFCVHVCVWRASCVCVRIYERGERRRCRATRNGKEGYRRSTDRGGFGRKESESRFDSLLNIGTDKKRAPSCFLDAPTFSWTVRQSGGANQRRQKNRSSLVYDCCNSHETPSSELTAKEIKVCCRERTRGDRNFTYLPA